MARKRATTSTTIASATTAGLKAPVVVQATPVAPARASKASAATCDTGCSAPSSSATAHCTTKAMPTHDMIAKRAYEIWVAKGKPVGKDLENWQQAERELYSKA